MTRRTKKVGVVGKYGTRYGASLRKRVKKVEVLQHARYECPFCAKKAIRRSAIGIWGCKACGTTLAGGAYTLHTNAGKTARANVRRLRAEQIALQTAE